jgi:hypothetical protein
MNRVTRALRTGAQEGRTRMKGLALGAAVVVLTAAAAFGQTATVTVTQIEAVGSAVSQPKIDPKLSGMSKLLPPGFAEYRLINSTRQGVSLGQTATWTLAGGKLFDVTLEAMEGKGQDARYTTILHLYARTGGGVASIVNIRQKVVKGGSSRVIDKQGSDALVVAVKVD